MATPVELDTTIYAVDVTLVVIVATI
jgi:hypothetical protein